MIFIVSTIAHVLIVIAVVVTLPVCAVYIHRRIHRYVNQHKQPDQAQLRVLWVKLWVVVACMVVYLVSAAVLLARSGDKASLWWSLFWVGLFTWMIISTILQICQYQKRLKKP